MSRAQNLAPNDVTSTRWQCSYFVFNFCLTGGNEDLSSFYSQVYQTCLINWGVWSDSINIDRVDIRTAKRRLILTKRTPQRMCDSAADKDISFSSACCLLIRTSIKLKLKRPAIFNYITAHQHTAVSLNVLQGYWDHLLLDIYTLAPTSTRSQRHLIYVFRSYLLKELVMSIFRVPQNILPLW